ncbi:MAG: hypothetical protein CL969_04340 [Euryarchaeota archaeon]|jgi:hypothetical protein|nr:hypothetical protein [Euryarchaeota archaeon]MDP6378545.1 hypothetical protein [Candidatus Thalassarchaeaceae archaeon]MDP6741978.1 hypothetical protein [Candidatus Thalassarchaeaceae archaeon]MDP7043331.1 hypothetical protein [Candidatus Thalassarchaeaceae archaeon]|tara:strand:- start:311 stop:532 length:222 start_codon:yes stop_codon:yes gene_type:complete
MAIEDLTKLERRLFEWIKKSDFETVPWSSQRAAEAFDVSEDEIREALAALTSKIPHNIYVHYNEGAIRVSAED